MASVNGLTDAEVHERRAKGLGHSTENRTSRTYAQIVRDNLFTFINTTLISIGVVLIVMGQINDAIMSAGLAVINAAIGIVQEASAKRRLDEIALLTRAKVTVVRDGQETQLDPGEVVIGDVFRVTPGDQILLDGKVIGDDAFNVDESLLTGESDAVRKKPGDEVHAGSYCLSGSGYYVGEKSGDESLAGSIASQARQFTVALTPLQRGINLITRVLLVIVAFFLILVLLGSWIHDTSWTDVLISAAVVVGIVPSGLFLMVTITYSMASVRLAKQDALIQQANAVESLSNVTVFCCDKTGTLTANKLKLDRLEPIGIREEELRCLLGRFSHSGRVGNKTSHAIADACPGEPATLTGEIPFSSARKWSAISADEPGFSGVFALGAPEMLGPLTDDAPEPPEGWTDEGLRVLLFACSPSQTPLDPEAAELPGDLKAVGWLGLADELRPNLKETLDGLRAAKVELKIISGDNPETVAALARQAGLSKDAVLVSGMELEEMSEAEFAESALNGTVFGRITPQQKERLVDAMQKRGKYVAMTGDGVNDVLSLKKANLGIAMESGSPATRGVADIVLLNDSFAAVPLAFKEGQRIRHGLTGILDLFLTRVFTVALVILCVLAVQAGFPFSPGHMSLLTTLTVGIPTFGLALWAQPGRAPKNLYRSLLRFIFPASVLLTAAAFGVYALFFFLHDQRFTFFAYHTGGRLARLFLPDVGHPVARDGITYVLIIGGLWLVIFAAPPTKFWAVCEEVTGDWRPAILAALMLPLYVLVMQVEFLRNLFGVKRMSLVDYALLTAMVTVVIFLLREVWKHRLFERFFAANWQD
jgi:cation-transporting ATPase E